MWWSKRKTERDIVDESAHDSDGHLIYIHIGKCGGSSLWKAVEQSNIIKNRFDRVTRVHVAKPPIHKKSRYMIVLRNPISRSISAFNWRYRLVIEEKIKIGNPDEVSALERYGSLNNLAESLFDGSGRINKKAARDFKSIGHLKKDISFYLSDIVKSVHDTQISFVLVNERLDADIRRILGVNFSDKIHENKVNPRDEQLRLSSAATENLRMFLKPEYDVIESVLRLHPLDKDAVGALLG